MIDASKLPRVPAHLAAGADLPVIMASDSAVDTQASTKLGAVHDARVAAVTPKTMKIHQGRYYVVDEEK